MTSMNATDLHAYGQMIAALDHEAWHRATLADYGQRDQREHWTAEHHNAVQQRDLLWSRALDQGAPLDLLLAAVNAASYALARNSGRHAEDVAGNGGALTSNYPAFPGLQ